MKHFTNGRVFFGALVAGMLYILISAGYEKWSAAAATDALRTRAGLHPLTESISVSEQLTVRQLKSVRQSGYATVIDLRPDGEAVGQPDAATMRKVAAANQLAFVYVPVPHGAIPDTAVEALGQALANSPRPILLYCRSGRRAARTWSLAEASRSGGPEAAQILAAVKASGQSADDLAGAIGQRVAQRASLQQEEK
ncbi:TIGR01244 family sulfur transferase [Massilia sp. CF038]|uniref:TIGR01244 family sulfur transferase n=1 Tax=Massilia sp. CF038 TaxID=1881045 RepID=UPI00091959E6|nr:TIGR01244 family sulfur transferase [Massilia sp. CF038]SHH55574.1 TIGR01244 family protein [Massilia sp. CF038]